MHSIGHFSNKKQPWTRKVPVLLPNYYNDKQKPSADEGVFEMKNVIWSDMLVFESIQPHSSSTYYTLYHTYPKPNINLSFIIFSSLKSLPNNIYRCIRMDLIRNLENSQFILYCIDTIFSNVLKLTC
jgi:hypothetical protein